MMACYRRVAALTLSVSAALAIPAAAADPYEVLHGFTSPRRRGARRGSSRSAESSTASACDGGAFAGGTAYEVEPATGHYRVVHSFSSESEGGSPRGRLAWVADDPAGPALYGTTTSGGPTGKGTVYRLTLDGQFTVVHSVPAQRHGGTAPGQRAHSGPGRSAVRDDVQRGRKLVGNRLSHRPAARNCRLFTRSRTDAVPGCSPRASSRWMRRV